MKKIILIAIIFVLLIINPNITQPVGADDPSGGTIVGDTVVYENDWGRLEVYPHTSHGEIHQEQYCNATWKLTANDLDIAFRFNDSLLSANVYEWIGSEWVEVTSAFKHTTYNGKHYYYVQNVHFEQDETRRFKWNYDVPFNSSGKWDLMGKLSSESIQYALENDRYVMIDPWWNTAWRHYTPIQINPTYIENDLTDFPVYVQIPNSIVTLCQNNGEDIRFIDSTNTSEFYYEIVEWNHSGISHVWVNISQIDSVEGELFLLYYGNDGATHSTYHDKTKTWDENYTLVLHMNDTVDSSSFAQTLADGSIIQEDGIAGNCTNTTYLRIADDPSLDTNDTFTMEVWTLRESENDGGLIAKKGVVDGRTRYMIDWYYNSHDTVDSSQAQVWNSDEAAFGRVKYATLKYKWYHQVVVFDRPNKIMRLYINGTQVNSSGCDMNNSITNDDVLEIGIDRGQWQGRLDEIRISNMTRNNTWINATYQNIANYSSFLSFGETISNIPYITVNLTTFITRTEADLAGFLPNKDFFTGNYDWGFFVAQSPGITATNAEFNFSGTTGQITPGDEFNETFAGLTENTLYYVRSWVSNATHFITSDGEGSFTTLQSTQVPTNVESNIETTNSSLNISWIDGANTDTTVIIRKVGSYPTSVTDGTEVYNSTSLYYWEEDLTQSYFFRLWGWNETYEDYSSNYADVSYGALILHCYNESNPTETLIFSIQIKNADGSVVYNETGLSNNHIVDVNDIPFGDDTQVLVNSTGYNFRIYYYDLSPNNVYNLSFYLPHINLSTTYLLQVTESLGSPLEGVKIQIQRFINTSGVYENISITLTDGAGQSDVYLIPGIPYQVTLSKENYFTQIVDYVTSPDIFIKDFIMYLDPNYGNITYSPNDVLTITGEIGGSNLYINITDIISSIDNCQIHIYEINHSTGVMSLLITFSHVNDSTITDVQVINISNSHKVIIFINHSVFGLLRYQFEFVGIYIPLTTPDEFDDVITRILKFNPFGWSNFFLFLAIGILYIDADREELGGRLALVGGIFLFFNYVVGFNTLFVTWAGGIVPTLVILSGVLIMWDDHRRGR